MAIRSPILALAAPIGLVLVAACHNTNAKEAPVGPQAANTDQTIDRIRKAVAAQRKIPARELEVTLLDDTGLPDLVAFTALQRPARGGRGTYDTGVASTTVVELDTQKAIAMLVRGWHYGAQRTVPPAKVASVVGLLEGASVQGSTLPLVTQPAIDALSPARRARAFLPRESVVDGKPAVEYWVSAGEPPLWKSTLVVAPDGTVTLHRDEAW